MPSVRPSSYEPDEEDLRRMQEYEGFEPDEEDLRRMQEYEGDPDFEPDLEMLERLREEEERSESEREELVERLVVQETMPARRAIAEMGEREQAGVQAASDSDAVSDAGVGIESPQQKRSWFPDRITLRNSLADLLGDQTRNEPRESSLISLVDRWRRFLPKARRDEVECGLADLRKDRREMRAEGASERRVQCVTIWRTGGIVFPIVWATIKGWAAAALLIAEWIKKIKRE